MTRLTTRGSDGGGRSLRVSDSFRKFVLAQLADLGDVTARSMFGGVGLYCGGLFFGLLARDVLYLKVNASTRRQYERFGCRPFKPNPTGPVSMQYYEVPLGVLESEPELLEWARQAVAVARQAAR